MSQWVMVVWSQEGPKLTLKEKVSNHVLTGRSFSCFQTNLFAKQDFPMRALDQLPFYMPAASPAWALILLQHNLALLRAWPQGITSADLCTTYCPTTSRGSKITCALVSTSAGEICLPFNLHSQLQFTIFELEIITMWLPSNFNSSASQILD